MDLERIKEFHGHAGMWVALGFRAGRFAMERLEPERIKDMVCSVELPYKTPYSCLLDGIQVSSCCTTGKCNLRFRDTEKELEIVFENTKTREKTHLQIKPEIIKQIKEREHHDKETENTEWLLNLPFDDIFIYKVGPYE